MYDRVQVKLAAKAAIRKSDPKTWKTTILYLLLAMAVPAVVTFLSMGPFFSALMNLLARVIRDPFYFESANDLPAAFAIVSRLVGTLSIASVVSVLFSLYQIIMTYGYQGWALKVWRGEPHGHGAIFAGFTRMGRVLGSGLMVAIFTALWSLIFVIPGGILRGLIDWAIVDSAPVLAGVLDSIVGIVISIGEMFIGYRYCLTPYFVMSEPDMGVFAAIKASRTAMKGRLVDRFVLDLSFLGWGLLTGLISLVAGLIATAVVVGGAVVSNLMAAPGGWMDLEDLLLDAVADPTIVLALIGTVIAGMVIGVAVGALVSLPLTQWLTAYMTISEAGFFSTVTGWRPAEERPAWETPENFPPVLPVIPPKAPEEPPAAPPAPPAEPPAEPPVPEEAPGETDGEGPTE